MADQPDLLDQIAGALPPPAGASPLSSTAAAVQPQASMAPQNAPDVLDHISASLPPPIASPTTVYQGSVLPFSRDSAGNVHFDPQAGLLGSAIRAFTLPHEVMTGQVDPESDQGVQRALEMATVVSPMNPAVRAGEMAIPGAALNTVPSTVPAPSAEALRDAADQGYKSARELGVEYTAPSVANMATGVGQTLQDKGIIPEVAPKTFNVLNKLQTPPDNATAPLSSLDAARSAFGNIAKDNVGSRDALAAKTVQGAIDQFVENADPSTVVAGPAATAANLYSDARGNYAAAKRSQALQALGDTAELRASVANSGQNIDNSIRQRAASLLLNPKATYGFSPDELSALKDVAAGTPSRNALRFVGNLLGGGGGLGSVISGGAGGLAGSAVGGPIVGAVTGAAIPALGITAKKTANALTSKALSGVDELVRQRSPLYQSMQANAPFSPGTIPVKNAALARGLMMAANNQQNQPTSWLSDLAHALITPAH